MATAEQLDASKLPAGLTYQHITASTPAKVSLHIVKLDSAAFIARVSVVKDRLETKSVSGSPSLASWLLADFAREYNSSAVVSGGYLSSFTTLEELGYVRSEKRSLNPRHESWLLNAIYCEDKDFDINYAQTVLPLRISYRGCLQAGPMLVFDGKPQLQDPEKLLASAETDVPAKFFESRRKYVETNQAHLFLCQQKTTLIIGYTDRIALQALARALSNGPEGVGLACDRAMRLPSGGLFVNGTVFGDDLVYRPNAIVVTHK